MPFHARLFTNLEDLSPHASRWNELVQLSAGNSIFLTWEWLHAWSTYVAGDTRYFIVAVFDHQEQLQAVLPLYQSSFQLGKFISYKCLRPMGDCHCGAEYPDLISAPDTAEEALASINNCLHQYQEQWDCLYFRYVAGWTDAVSRLARLCTHKSLFFRQQETVFSSILLPESMELFNRGISASLYTLIRRQKKKLERTGAISISLCQQEQDLPMYLDSLFRLHKKRWQSVGQKGSFIRRPLMQDFYTRFAATALRQGWLKIFALRIDSTILAVQIGYFYDGIFYQLQEGFDPDGPGGLGNVLRHMVIDWCITHKVQEFDYLGGDEEHKLKWGARQRPGYHLFSGSRTPKNLLLAIADIWPSGRYITEGPPASYGHSHD